MSKRRSLGVRLREDERGISTVIVVVSLVGILGAALLSLDFGSMWSSRRQIVTATDASVLNEAHVAAQTDAACNTDPLAGPTYLEYLFKNANQIVTNSWDCDLHPDTAHPGTGYVTVEARKFADTRFGGLFGMGDTEPYSLSAAEYGFVTKPEGLRPMSFCLQNTHILQWVWYQNWLKVQDGGTADPSFGQLDESTYNDLKDDGDVGHPDGGDADILFDPPADGRIDYPTNGPQISDYSPFGVVHRMFFTKEDVNESGSCGGGSSGNWGWIDFNGGSNSNEQSQDWVENGYDGEVSANDCNADGVAGDPCEGDTGSSGGSVGGELQFLVESEAQFYIPIFTNVQNPGANAEFTMWGFLPLILRGYKVSGAGGESARFFDFEFKDSFSSGPCCSKTPSNLGGPKGARICGVDHDGDTSDATIAARCGQAP